MFRMFKDRLETKRYNNVLEDKKYVYSLQGEQFAEQEPTVITEEDKQQFVQGFLYGLRNYLNDPTIPAPTHPTFPAVKGLQAANFFTHPDYYKPTPQLGKNSDPITTTITEEDLTLGRHSFYINPFQTGDVIKLPLRTKGTTRIKNGLYSELYTASELASETPHLTRTVTGYIPYALKKQYNKPLYTLTRPLLVIENNIFIPLTIEILSLNKIIPIIERIYFRDN